MRSTFDDSNPSAVAAAYHRERAARESAERERDEARSEVERLTNALDRALAGPNFDSVRKVEEENASLMVQIKRLARERDGALAHLRQRDFAADNFSENITSTLCIEIKQLKRKRDEAEKKLENAYVLIEELGTALSDVIKMREDSDPWPQTPEDQMERAEANEEIWQEARATLKKVERHWKS